MTSKISFSNMVKNDLKRRLWVISLLFLGFFLVFPVAALMSIENLLDRYQRGYILWDEVLRSVTNMAGAGHELLMVGIIVSAILCAYSCFSYLHSSRKVDLFHSFAVKRERLFAVQYVSGIVGFLLPYGINLLLFVVICVVNHVVTGTMISSLLIGFIVTMIYFLLLYHLTIVAILLTGKMLVSVLGLTVFCVWSLLTSSTVISYFSNCFDTFYQLEKSLFEKILSHLSPIQQYLTCAADFHLRVQTPLECLMKNGPSIIIAVCEGVLLLLAAIWLYRKRPSEAAGNAMAFPKWNPWIKVWILIPLSAGGGLFMASISGIDSLSWTLFGIIFTAIVGHCLIEVIFSYEFRTVLNHKGTLGISLVVVLAFIFICWFDLVGYDEKFPEMENLQSMAAAVDVTDSYISYWTDDEEYRYDNPTKYRLQHGQMTDVTAAYHLAKIGVENEKTNYLETEEISRATGVVVSYVNQSGKEMIRRYLVSYDQLQTCLGALYATENFKNGQYPLLNMNVDELVIVNSFYTDAYHDDVVTGFTIAQNKELFLCYQKELEKLTYDDMKAEKLIGMLRFTGMEGEGLAEHYYIYECFEETIALMKSFGCPIQRLPDTEDVKSINVYNYIIEEKMYENMIQEAAAAAGPEVRFESAEDIEGILAHCVVSQVPGYQVEEGYDIQIEVEVEGEKGNSHHTFSCKFKKDEIPQVVKEAYPQ